MRLFLKESPLLFLLLSTFFLGCKDKKVSPRSFSLAFVLPFSSLSPSGRPSFRSYFSLLPPFQNKNFRLVFYPSPLLFRRSDGRPASQPTEEEEEEEESEIKVVFLLLSLSLSRPSKQLSPPSLLFFPVIQPALRNSIPIAEEGKGRKAQYETEYRRKCFKTELFRERRKLCAKWKIDKKKCSMKQGE